VLSKGSRPWEICLDPECPTKSSGKKAADSQEDRQADDG